MIDNMSVIVDGFSIKEWELLLLIPSEIKVYQSKNLKMYFSWENLRFEYYPISKRLKIKNSLHVFYNAVVKENPIGRANYDDFTFENLSNTILFISEKLNRPPKDFRLWGAFEFGLNISTFPLEPVNDILDCYKSHVSTRINEFYVHKPKGKGKVTGKSCFLFDYRIKFYNKSKQSKIKKEGILRYEICFNKTGRLQKMLGLKEVTYEDLLKTDTLTKLSGELMSVYDKINKVPSLTDDVPLDIRLELYAYSDPILSKWHQTTMTKWKYSQLRKKGKSLLDKYSNHPNSVHSKIRDTMVEKLNFLINTTTCNKRVSISQVNY